MSQYTEMSMEDRLAVNPVYDFATNYIDGHIDDYQNIIDLGCSDGIVSGKYSEHVNVVGIDSDEGDINDACSNFPSGHYIHDDIRNLANYINDDGNTLILALDVLEHLEIDDIRSLITDLNVKLKRYTLLVSMPVSNTIPFLKESIEQNILGVHRKTGLMDPTHKTLLSENELRGLFQSCALVVQESRTVRWNPNLDKASLKYKAFDSIFHRAIPRILSPINEEERMHKMESLLAYQCLFVLKH